MIVNRGRQQAQYKLEYIKEIMNRPISSPEDIRDKKEELYDIPLEISIREDWHAPGYESTTGQYRILLCTGGPEVQIVGNLNHNSNPETVRLEYRDWATPWTTLRITPEEEVQLIKFASEFYYG